LSQAEFDIKKWVKEYTETLLKRALYRINQKEIAEDLVQETFITAYQKIHQFKGNKRSISLKEIVNHKPGLPASLIIKLLTSTVWRPEKKQKLLPKQKDLIRKAVGSIEISEICGNRMSNSWIMKVSI
jgi:hypothetical protein